MSSIANPALWTLFVTGVVGLLALDLFVFHRKPHAVRTREALIWSTVWIAMALLFNALVYFHFGAQRGLEFLTGYLIEKALAIDNLFVFAVIFSYFKIQPADQHRVLFWGVVGALVFRAVFIALGATLLTHLHWITYVFGAALVVTGLKLLRREAPIRAEGNRLFHALRTLIPTSPVQSGQFFIRDNSIVLATPLFLALVLVEISDVVFAFDSIPAIFAVTSDTFIIFTSNVFAILGLRAMYSLLAQFLTRLKYLRFGLALVLVFVGGKMLFATMYKIPIEISLAVVAALLLAAAIPSLLVSRDSHMSPSWEERRH
ncbi:MAG TPA: TerC/Alx family metal homeostasis membrane protein [Terriglobales bacterium]|nr:TerC/Alx family metal homeostasis membrane protein [Terriglobales bacterium]